MTAGKRLTDTRQLNYAVPTSMHTALVKAAAARGMTLASYLKFIASEQINNERKHASVA